MPEEIADNWGYLSMAQAYAALTYYHANREEIEQCRHTADSLSPQVVAI